MRRCLCLLSCVVALASGCASSDDRPASLGPSSAGGSGGTAAAGAGGSGSDSGSDSGSGGAAGDGGSANDGGADEVGSIADLPNDSMLVELHYAGGDCALFALPPSTAGRVTTFYDCYSRDFRVRRTDGGLYYLEDGAIVRYDDPAHPLDVACKAVAPFDFDAEDHVYYRCVGGTTGPLYRDLTLIAESVVPVVAGVFADGRILWDGWEEYAVMDGQAAELARHETEFGWSTLEYASTILEDRAFLLFNASYVGDDEKYSVFEFGAAGFQQIASFPSIATVPSNFGYRHRFDATGTLYVASDDRVVRYAPDGTSSVLWEVTGDDLRAGELVHYYVTQ